MPPECRQRLCGLDEEQNERSQVVMPSAGARTHPTTNDGNDVDDIELDTDNESFSVTGIGTPSPRKITNSGSVFRRASLSSVSVSLRAGRERSLSEGSNGERNLTTNSDIESPRRRIRRRPSFRSGSSKGTNVITADSSSDQMDRNSKVGDSSLRKVVTGSTMNTTKDFETDKIMINGTSASDTNADAYDSGPKGSPSWNRHFDKDCDENKTEPFERVALFYSPTRTASSTKIPGKNDGTALQRSTRVISPPLLHATTPTSVKTTPTNPEGSPSEMMTKVLNHAEDHDDDDYAEATTTPLQKQPPTTVAQVYQEGYHRHTISDLSSPRRIMTMGPSPSSGGGGGLFPRFESRSGGNTTTTDEYFRRAVFQLNRGNYSEAIRSFTESLQCLRDGVGNLNFNTNAGPRIPAVVDVPSTEDAIQGEKDSEGSTLDDSISSVSGQAINDPNLMTSSAQNNPSVVVVLLLEREATIVNGLAYCHYQLGAYPSALVHYRECLRLRQQRICMPSASSALVQPSSFQQLPGQGSFSSRHLAKLYLDAARTHHNLGLVHMRSKDPHRAVESLTHALQLRRKWLGTDHIFVGCTERCLGDAYFHLPNRSQAVKHYQNALRIFTSTSGSGGGLPALLPSSTSSYSAAIVRTHLHMAHALTQERRYSEAETELREALALSTIQTSHPQQQHQHEHEQHNKNDPLTEAEIHHALGTVLAESSSTSLSTNPQPQRPRWFSEALTHLKRALHLRGGGQQQLQQESSDHLSVASTWVRTGEVLRRAGHREHAAEAYRKALDIYERRLGHNHFRLVEILQALGDLTTSSSSENNAIRISCYHRILRILGYPRAARDDLRTAAALTGLGQAHGTGPHAVAAWTESYRIQVVVRGRDHPVVASTLLKLADLLCSTANNPTKTTTATASVSSDDPKNNNDESTTISTSDRALRMYEEVLRVRKKVLPKNHADVADVLHSIGNARFRLQQNYAKALSAYSESFRIKQRHLQLKQTDPSFLTTLTNLGHCHFKLGHESKALVAYRRCLDLRKNALRAMGLFGPNEGFVASLGKISKAIRELEYDHEQDQEEQRPQLQLEKENDQAQSKGGNEEKDIQKTDHDKDEPQQQQHFSKETQLSVGESEEMDDQRRQPQPQPQLQSHSQSNQQRDPKNVQEKKQRKQRRNLIVQTLTEISSTLHSIAMVHQKLLEHEKALEAYLVALQVLKMEALNKRNSQVNGTNEGLPSSPPEMSRALVTLTETVGLLYYRLRFYEEALAFFFEALKRKRQMFGSESVHVAHTLNNIGNVLFAKADFDEAMVMYQDALELKKEHLGDDHMDVANTLNNIGNVLYTRGAYAEAKAAYLETYQRKAAVLGERHLDVASSLKNLGDVRSRLEEYDQALEAYRSALDIFRGGGRPDDSNNHNISTPNYNRTTTNACLSVLSGIASIHEARKDHSLVIKTLEEELALHKNAAVSGHRISEDVVCEALYRMGRAQHAMDNKTGALKFYHKCLHKKKTQLKGGEESASAKNPQQPQKKQHRNPQEQNQSRSPRANNKNSGKVKVKLSAGVGQKNNPLSSNPSGGKTREDLTFVANVLQRIASVQQDLGHWNKAVQALNEGLRIRKRLFGKDHISVGVIMETLGIVLYRSSDLPESMVAFTEALRIKKVNIGGSHGEVATTLNSIANVHYALGDYPKALEAYSKALTMKEAALGSKHVDVGTCLCNLAGVLTILGRHAEALAAYRRCLEIGGDGRTSSTSASTLLLRVGEVHLAMGHGPEAVAALERACQLAWLQTNSTPDANADSTALPTTTSIRCRYKLGVAYLHQKRWEEARTRLSFVLRVSETAEGATDPLQGERTTCLDQLAQACSNSGRMDECLTALNELLTIQKAAGDLDGMTSTYRKIGDAHRGNDDGASATAAYREARELSQRHLLERAAVQKGSNSNDSSSDASAESQQRRTNSSSLAR